MALNGCANARMLRESGFERVFVPPAPGDAGCALGAALLVDRIHFKNRDVPCPDHPFSDRGRGRALDAYRQRGRTAGREPRRPGGLVALIATELSRGASLAGCKAEPSSVRVRLAAGPSSPHRTARKRATG